MDKIKPLFKLNGINIYQNIVYKVQPFNIKEHNTVLDNIMRTDTTSLVTSVSFIKFDDNDEIRVHFYPDKNRKCYHPELRGLEDKIKIIGIDESRNSKEESYFLKERNDAELNLKTFRQSLELARNEYV